MPQPAAPSKIVLSASELFALEGVEAPGDPHLLEAALREKFAFLPQPLTVAVSGDSLAIGQPPEAEEDRAEAGRLAERALRRSREGRHERAAELYRRALGFQPSLLTARRSLARALLETREEDQAKAVLTQFLRLSPRDEWALAALADGWRKPLISSVMGLSLVLARAARAETYI
jgi:tetratricopeptide (TPR) repeat protein